MGTLRARGSVSAYSGGVSRLVVGASLKIVLLVVGCAFEKMSTLSALIPFQTWPHSTERDSGVACALF